MDGLLPIGGPELFPAEAAASVGVALLKAACGGAVAALFAWAVCRWAPRLPAGARFALWWLVCLKLVLGFVAALYAFAVVVAVPHRSLPSAPPALRTFRRWATAAPAKAPPAPTARPAASPELEAPDVSPLAESPAPPLSRPPSPAEVALLLWVAGVAVCAFGQAHASAPLRRALAAAVPVDLSATLGPLCQALGVSRIPAVAVSSDIAGPLVCGLWRPVIVLPASLLGRLSADELRMALAHELAHVRRRDLWLDLIPALARALFFFLPPVHLACRECALCREEACDALAVAATQAAPGGYGALLLKTVAAQRQANAPMAAAGMAAAHFGQVKRRLVALSAPNCAAARRAGFAATLLAAAGLVPWRLSAVAEGAALLGGTAGGDALPPLPRYRVTDLGTLGGNVSDAFALSDDGRVAGAANLSRAAGRGHAFVWQDGAMTDLSAGSVYRHSFASAVNRRGMAAAWAYNRENRPYAFLWDGDERRYLGALPGFRYSRALGLNSAGQVVGVSQRASAEYGALRARAFVWEGGRMRDLGTLGGPYSVACAVNESGQVVGKADLPRGADGTGETHAFLFDDGRMTDLGTLPGGRNSLAYAVNERGQAVGYSEAADGRRHAFVHDRSRMRDLGLPPGAAATIAYGVNESGLAVGAAEFAGNGADGRRAVLWQFSRSGAVRSADLNDLLPPGSGWTLETARSVNRSGQIVGQGRFGGRRRAYLLTPEP